MYDKSYYRAEFNNMKQVIKITSLGEEIGIPRSTLSTFMRNEAYNYMMSVERLDSLHKHVRERINSLIS